MGHDSQIYCWKCLDEGHLVSFPLYKVGNSYVFACKRHKDVEVRDGSYSLTNKQLEKGKKWKPLKCQI
jgi:hypothetical protein